MNTGKTLFAQLMDFHAMDVLVTRIVDRYGGDHRVRTLVPCAEQSPTSMAFAQLTYRLKPANTFETCLSVHACETLCIMGFRLSRSGARRMADFQRRGVD